VSSALSKSGRSPFAEFLAQQRRREGRITGLLETLDDGTGRLREPYLTPGDSGAKRLTQAKSGHGVVKFRDEIAIRIINYE
jgi:hypothetical protein